MYHPRNESILGRIRDLETANQMLNARVHELDLRLKTLASRTAYLQGSPLPPPPAPYQPRPLSEPVSGQIPPPSTSDYQKQLEEKMRQAVDHAKKAANEVQSIAKTAVERINQSWKDAK